MNHCPCNKCIYVPICKRKHYSLLVTCDLLWKYLIDPFTFTGSERPNGRIKLVHKALKPTMWILFYDEYGRVMVDNYTGYEKCHFIY